MICSAVGPALGPGAARGALAAACATSCATMRPCAPEPRMRLRSIPEFDRQSARQRRDHAAAGQPRRAVVALGRAHLEERIEGDRRACATRRRRERRGRRHAGHALGQRTSRRGRRWYGSGLRRGRRGGSRCSRSAGRGTAAIGDDRDDRSDRRDFARLHADFGELTRGGRGHLHRYLVGLDLEQIVAGLHGIARRFEPLGDLALGDSLAELRHQHVHELSLAPLLPRHPEVLAPRQTLRAHSGPWRASLEGCRPDRGRRPSRRDFVAHLRMTDYGAALYIAHVNRSQITS